MEETMTLNALKKLAKDHSNEHLSMFKSGLSAKSADKKEEVDDYKENREELRKAIDGSNDVLAMANTAWTIFRDTVVLDRAKLTVTRRNFIRSANLMSIRMEDVLNVTMTIGPVFGTIKVYTRVINSGPYTIGSFYRSDAIRLKRITQGYVIALQGEIDCGSIPTSELIPMLDQLGEDDHETSVQQQSYLKRQAHRVKKVAGLR